MSTGAGFDQLRRHPHPAARVSHAAFQNVAHAQFTADIPDRYGFSFVRKA